MKYIFFTNNNYIIHKPALTLAGNLKAAKNQISNKMNIRYIFVVIIFSTPTVLKTQKFLYKIISMQNLLINHTNFIIIILSIDSTNVLVYEAN